jgi:phenylalanyl-tRNA synthetase beta chain
VVPVRNDERLFERRIRTMVAAQGFTEVYNHSFVSEEQALAFGFDPDEHVRVANPISSEQGLMRLSLLPNIVRNIRDNLRHFGEFRLFELGFEIHKRSSGLPDEILHLMAAVFRKDDGRANLAELKRLALCLMPGCEARPSAARSFEHPARAAELHWQGALVGRLFELYPGVVEGRAGILDIDLRTMKQHQPGIGRFKPLRRYPTSAFDLSVVAGLRELAGIIEAKLKGFAAADLVDIEFLRLYSGPPLAEGRKSVSYRLTVGAQDRTLSSDEVSAIRARIIEGMERLGYELRV